MQYLQQAQQKASEAESEIEEEVMPMASSDTDCNAPHIDLGKENNFPNSACFILLSN